MLEKVDEKMDEVNENYETANARLKQLLDDVRMIHLLTNTFPCVDGASLCMPSFIRRVIRILAESKRGVRLSYSSSFCWRLSVTYFPSFDDRSNVCLWFFLRNYNCISHVKKHEK